ncbi:bifunctional DNA primase/polymerase [Apilactobacillus xinyiensis]|uniref:bifunctional DNA primase/polymerase n=1 Tax=Apilactobacillus xinyiensis TaxID=2841032 RepID=UPI0020107180|nr:bifunctional DNA primase/polymerase [Apilactobacillus xinyiensis]MCL0330850.1 bifunctional DNA primase/polymerase [Apilactobacillus xinyiensis]
MIRTQKKPLDNTNDLNNRKNKSINKINYITNLAEKEMYLLPVSANNKVPLKRYVEHGYKSATANVFKLMNWFKDVDTNNNKGVALRLDTSNIVVVDVDINHGNGDGKAELTSLYNQGKILPPDTKIERTQNGGLHYFFRTDKKLKNKKITDNIELKTDQAIIYPTANYSLVNGDFKDIKPLPSWITADGRKEPNYSNVRNYSNKRNMWVGKALDSIFTATIQGNRDVYLTSLCGKLLRTGAKAETVYNLMFICNENMDIPLPDNQVNKIFKSILKRFNTHN